MASSNHIAARQDGSFHAMANAPLGMGWHGWIKQRGTVCTRAHTHDTLLASTAAQSGTSHRREHSTNLRGSCKSRIAHPQSARPDQPSHHTPSHSTQPCRPWHVSHCSLSSGTATLPPRPHFAPRLRPMHVRSTRPASHHLPRAMPTTGQHTLTRHGPLETAYASDAPSSRSSAVHARAYITLPLRLGWCAASQRLNLRGSDFVVTALNMHVLCLIPQGLRYATLHTRASATTLS